MAITEKIYFLVFSPTSSKDTGFLKCLINNNIKLTLIMP